MTAPVVAGIDVGGTRIKAALVDRAGVQVASTVVPTPRGLDRPGALVDAVAATVVDLRVGAPDHEPVACGVVVPGIVDDVRGVAVYASNLGWRDLQLAGPLEERLGLPVALGHDVRAGGLAATEHLIELGHTEIAFLAGDDEEGLNHVVPQARRTGWERAMASAGLPVRPEFVLHGGFDTAVSRGAVDAMLDARHRHPTAIFAGSDEMALGALLSLWAHGLRVPQDVSVIGIDGHPLSQVFSLSTFEQDPAEQGAAAVRMLLAELGGETARPRAVRHPVRFLDRGSTASPRSTEQRT